MSENFGTGPPSHLTSIRPLQRKSQKFATYLGLVASTIQRSPNKMLTFSQLMDRLEEFIMGERKCFENTVRVCLSTYDCFFKIPTNPHNRHCKKNYWKVDENRITMKMVRRHFVKADLDMFPLLSSKIRMETSTTTSMNSSELSVAKAVDRCEVKFTSSFSIESILKRDSLCVGLKPSPLSVLSYPELVMVQYQGQSERGFATKRRLIWDATMGGYLVHYPDQSYHSYLNEDATSHESICERAWSVKRMRLSTDTFSIHTRKTKY